MKEILENWIKEQGEDYGTGIFYSLEMMGKFAEYYHNLQLHKTQVRGSVSIKLEDWDYTCGDGCCTSYGTKLILNGKELEHPNEDILDNSYVGMDVKTSITAVLKELGFNATFE